MTSDVTIINALRILARDVESEDGVANMVLQEAAERFCELLEENKKLKAKLETGHESV